MEDVNNHLLHTKSEGEEVLQGEIPMAEDGGITPKAKSNAFDTTGMQSLDNELRTSKGALAIIEESKKSRSPKKRGAGDSFANATSGAASKTDRKGRRGGVAGASLDKEAKEALKNAEGKVEELRKASMNEINRLEAMMEKDNNEKAARFAKFEEGLHAELAEVFASNGDMQKQVG